MSIEGGPSGFDEEVPVVELPFDDETLHEAITDSEGSRALLDHDPILWARSAVGADTERGASFISDQELAERHSEGGFAEWDPPVAQSVRDYLQQQGFYCLRGSSE